ncbi:hypothetical protein niasHT_030112 [Heterodera trifolii]|uniref:Ubiquitin carboxyl-terminal hydrolase n=1 Tax=Heterodera trifolii TaxID=157864 RepID=A0ABD2JGL8_9BILA
MAPVSPFDGILLTFPLLPSLGFPLCRHLFFPSLPFSSFLCKIPAQNMFVALESNPKIFNMFLDQFGFEGVEFNELFGFDPELISCVPGPHLALVFCYPYREKAFEYRKGIYGQLVASGKGTVPKWAFFTEQFIANACGYHAMLHAVLNNLGKIEISENGYFEKMIEQFKDQKMKSEETEEIEESTSSQCSSEDFVSRMTDFFSKISLEGSETDVSGKIDHHFIVFIVRDGHLFEFDSLQKFPRDCGPSTNETLLLDAGNICQELMDHLGEISCSAIALCAKEN